MDIVYEKNGKWFSSYVILLRSGIILSSKHDVNSINDVNDIDSYVHISDSDNVEKDKVLQNLAVDGITNIYIKDCRSSKRRICDSCTKACKSDKVVGCSTYEGKKGKDGELFWKA